MTPNELAVVVQAIENAQTAQADPAWEPYIAPAIGLLGVAVGGMLQWALATSTTILERKHRLEDEHRKEARDRGISSLALAEHL